MLSINGSIIDVLVESFVEQRRRGFKQVGCFKNQAKLSRLNRGLKLL